MNTENTNTNTQVQEKQGEVLSFDEILKDKAYQSEFDKRLSKALDTAKTNWEKEAEGKRTEAEKLAKMDADEKHKYELSKVEQEKNDALAKLNAYELKEQATNAAVTNYLTLKGYTKSNLAPSKSSKIIAYGPGYNKITHFSKVTTTKVTAKWGQLERFSHLLTFDPYYESGPYGLVRANYY